MKKCYYSFLFIISQNIHLKKKLHNLCFFRNIIEKKNQESLLHKKNSFDNFLDLHSWNAICLTIIPNSMNKHLILWYASLSFCFTILKLPSINEFQILHILTISIYLIVHKLSLIRVPFFPVNFTLTMLFTIFKLSLINVLLCF